jgi:hypothetical protein
VIELVKNLCLNYLYLVYHKTINLSIATPIKSMTYPYAQNARTVHIYPQLQGISTHETINICIFVHDKKEQCIAYEATNEGISLPFKTN